MRRISMENLNPFNRHREIYTPPGVMVYDLISFDDGPIEFSFHIKEETNYIFRHQNPLIEVRMGMMQYKNVYIIPMMVQVNFDEEMMYETMFNYHQTSGGEPYLHALQQQDNIYLIFYDEKNKESRRIRIKNQFKQDVQQFTNILKTTEPWSMEDFDRAKEQLYANFPTGMDLWRAIDEKNLMQ